MAIKILLPLDGSKSGESAIPNVEDIVSKFKPELNPEVILFHVITDAYSYISDKYENQPLSMRGNERREAEAKAIDYLNKVGELMKAKGIKFVPKVAVGLAADEIIKFAKDDRVDMIVMSTLGSTGINKWEFGSVTNRVIHMETRIPILIIKATGK